MTGRYKLYLPLDSTVGRGFRKDRAPRFDDCWHRFVALCASLDRDGLSYDVTFNFAPSPEQCSPAVPGPYALITAQGTPKQRAKRRAKVYIMPPPLSAEQVQKRLIAAKQAAVPQLARQQVYTWSGRDWLALRTKQRRIGRILARIKAQGRTALNESDFRRVQAAIGDYTRWIALTPEGLLQTARREYKPFRPYQPEQPAARLTRLADYHEYAYWRELARLQAERRAA